MHTTSTLLFLFTLLCIISGCSSTSHSDNTIYHFDYKLKANSKYKTAHSFRTNTKKTMGMSNLIVTGPSIDTSGIIVKPWKIKKSSSDSTNSVDSIQNYLGFTISVTEYIPIPVEDELAMNLLPKPEDVESIVVDGFSLNQKQLQHITDAYSKNPELPTRKISNYRSLISATNPWKSQEQYPSGPMMIGDTFRLQTEKKHQIPTSKFYVLNKVNNSIAHFTIEDDSALLGYAAKQVRKSKGTLKYNLKENYYSEYEHFSQHVHEGKSSMHKMVQTIEKIK